MSLLKTLHCFPLKHNYFPVGLHYHDIFFSSFFLSTFSHSCAEHELWVRHTEKGAGPRQRPSAFLVLSQVRMCSGVTQF